MTALPPLRRLLERQSIRFLLIGLWNTLFGYGLYLLLYLWLQGRWHYLLLAVITHFIAVANAFIGHRLWVFRSRAPWPAEFFRYNLSYLGTLALGSGLLVLLVEYLTLTPPVAQGLVILANVGLSYGLHRWFSFKTASHPPRPSNNN
ncbi:MAG: hypothetical protein RIR00_1481 [Pseudomonadota bacterium]|jgi:putative flippase GtrA